MHQEDIVERVEELKKTLLFNQEGKIWVLIDPTLHPVGYDETTDRWVELASSFIKAEIPGYPMNASNCPLWLQADLNKDNGEVLLQETLLSGMDELAPAKLSQGMGRRICAWVVTQNAVASAEHLARQLIQVDSSGLSSMVRLYDPAVLWAMWSSLSPVQQASWLSGCNTWTTLKPNGRPFIIKGDEVSSAKEHQSSLRLTETQWTRIHVMAAFNAALRDWLQESPHQRGFEKNEQLEMLRDSAMGTMGRAWVSGHQDPDFQYAIAHFSFNKNFEFDRSQLFKEEYFRLKNEKNNVWDALAAIDEEKWNAIRRSMGQVADS